MKKQIFMALLAAVSSFAMVSCGDDDKNNDPKPSNQTTVPEAKYSENSNSVTVEYAVYAGEIGAQSWKNEYKFSNGFVTEHTATLECSSAMLAQWTYEEWKSSEGQSNDEDGIVKNVSQKGNTIIIEYEVENGMTDKEAIITSKLLDQASNDEGVELTEEEKEYLRTQMSGYEGDEDVNEDDVIDLGDILSE